MSTVRGSKLTMLSGYGWYSSALPFTKNSRGTSHKNSILQIPRGLAVHVLTSSTASAHGYYPTNSRDSDGQTRPPYYSSKTAKESSTSRPSSQPVIPQTPRTPAGIRTTEPSPRHSSLDRKPAEANRSFKIIQNSYIPDSYIYECSIASRSDIFPSSASSSSDTDSIANSALTDDSERPEFVSSSSSLRITNPSGETNTALTSSPSSSPRPLPAGLPPLTVALQSQGPARRFDQESEQSSQSIPRSFRQATVETVSDVDDGPRGFGGSDAPDMMGVMHDWDAFVNHNASVMPEASAPLSTTDVDRVTMRDDRESPERNVAAADSRQRSSLYMAPPGIESVCSSRTVRWSENLVCPSPILPSMRRKGWYNRRGDQLWTNDGQFVPSEGHEYPPDLDDYPEFGTGWMNEEGIRIDMDHRLIPKPPLRSVLKKTSPRESFQNARPRSEIRAGR